MGKITNFLRWIFADANKTVLVTEQEEEIIEIIEDEVIEEVPQTTKPKRVIQLKGKNEKSTEQIVSELKEVDKKKVDKKPTSKTPAIKDGNIQPTKEVPTTKKKPNAKKTKKK